MSIQKNDNSPFERTLSSPITYIAQPIQNNPEAWIWQAILSLSVQEKSIDRIYIT